jgi:protein involved in polysaccharide export with SLBB domain
MLSQRRLSVLFLAVSIAAPRTGPSLQAQEVANARTQAGSGARTATVRDVILQPGDHVKITVLSEDKDLTGEFEIGPDSALRHPLYNKVKVVGISVAALKERIASLLGRLEKDPQFEVEPLLEVTLTGQVNKPGVYFLAPETSIEKAIDNSAAGANERGNPNAVTLLRSGRKLSVRRTDDSSSGADPGKIRAAERIQSGDRITVDARSSALGKVSPFISFGLSLVSLVSLTLLVAAQNR